MPWPRIWHGCRLTRNPQYAHFPRCSRQRMRVQGQWVQVQRRHFGLESILPVLLPPAVFGGLLVTLWTYKCLMMVIFQNKIIYMPFVPPFSRLEKVVDYATQCKPVTWYEHDIRASDGTAIKILESCIGGAEHTDQNVVVLYLQGNASSLPPRLPYLSSIIKTLANNKSDDKKYTIVALSYRGFWQSKGRPSQPGIELDIDAAFDWLLGRYHPQNTKIVVWGQSIGAGAATVGLANLLRRNPSALNRITGLLLETPFVDLKVMLVALYPQRFLPYRYLAPFLRSTWDSKTALERIGGAKPSLRTLILEAGDDEIVPSGQGAILEKVCEDQGITVTRASVPGALHTEAMVKSHGRSHITGFLKSL